MFFNNYRWNYRWYFSRDILTNEASKIFLRICSVSKSVGNNIFLLPTDLLTDKKLPMKDSPMEHFRK